MRRYCVLGTALGNPRTTDVERDSDCKLGSGWCRNRTHTRWYCGIPRLPGLWRSCTRRAKLSWLQISMDRLLERDPCVSTGSIRCQVQDIRVFAQAVDEAGDVLSTSYTVGIMHEADRAAKWAEEENSKQFPFLGSAGDL
ncbi:hypothetical protein AUP68_08172 [Ilyonectria robusta]